MIKNLLKYNLVLISSTILSCQAKAADATQVGGEVQMNVVRTATEGAVTPTLQKPEQITASQYRENLTVRAKEGLQRRPSVIDLTSLLQRDFLFQKSQVMQHTL